MKVIFSNRAYSAILAETAEKIKTETGGLFLGCVNGDVWYVIEAIDPGPKSIFQIAYFEYDQAYTQHLINKIANLYNAPLTLIGLWHRHPGSFDQFSSTDDGTNTKYAGMRPEGAISGLVNIDPEFRLTIYHVARPCRYSVIEYEVGDNLIPDELLKYKNPDRFYRIMNKRLHSDGTGHRENGQVSSMHIVSFMQLISEQLEEIQVEKDACIEEASEQILDDVIEDISFLTDECGIALAISVKDKHLLIEEKTSSDPKAKLRFYYVASSKELVLNWDGKDYAYSSKLLRGLYITQKTLDIKKVNEQTKTGTPVSFVEALKKMIRSSTREEDTI